MLIVSRRRDQSVRIGDDVQVVVVKVEGGTVQLGISAPSDVTILRTELLGRDAPYGQDERKPADPAAS